MTVTNRELRLHMYQVCSDFLVFISAPKPPRGIIEIRSESKSTKGGGGVINALVAGVLGLAAREVGGHKNSCTLQQ